MPPFKRQPLPFPQSLVEQVYGISWRKEGDPVVPIDREKLKVSDLEILWNRMLKSPEKKTSVVVDGHIFTMSLTPVKKIATVLKEKKQ